MNAGLHRLVKEPNTSDKRNKRLLFWHIYTMDRALALNLGRAPNIQDYDIHTDILSYPEDIDGPLGYINVRWIELSKLQGEIYLQLYSAQAERESLQTKIDSAKQLAARCLELRESLSLVGQTSFSK